MKIKVIILGFFLFFLFGCSNQLEVESIDSYPEDGLPNCVLVQNTADGFDNTVVDSAQYCRVDVGTTTTTTIESNPTSR